MEFITQKEAFLTAEGTRKHKGKKDVILVEEILDKIDLEKLLLLVKCEKIELYQFVWNEPALMLRIEKRSLRDMKEWKKAAIDAFRGSKYWIEKAEAERLLAVKKTDDRKSNDSKANERNSKALQLVLSWIDKDNIKHVKREEVMKYLGEGGFDYGRTKLFYWVWASIPEAKKAQGGRPIENSS